MLSPAAAAAAALSIKSSTKVANHEETQQMRRRRNSLHRSSNRSDVTGLAMQELDIASSLALSTFPVFPVL